MYFVICEDDSRYGVSTSGPHLQWEEAMAALDRESVSPRADERLIIEWRPHIGWLRVWGWMNQRYEMIAEHPVEAATWERVNADMQRRKRKRP